MKDNEWSYTCFVNEYQFCILVHYLQPSARETPCFWNKLTKQKNYKLIWQLILKRNMKYDSSQPQLNKSIFDPLKHRYINKRDSLWHWCSKLLNALRQWVPTIQVSGDDIYCYSHIPHVRKTMATGDTSNTLENCLNILHSKTAHPEQFLRWVTLKEKNALIVIEQYP